MSSARTDGFAGYSGQTWDYTPPIGGSVTTTFVVPRVTCDGARRAIAPSVSTAYGGQSRPSAAALFVGCYAGQAHYWPELELKGRFTNYPTDRAHPGDTIVLRLTSSPKHGPTRKGRRRGRHHPFPKRGLRA
jgi:hypothetical protein